MKGLLISIYKNPAYAGCSLGGVSADHDQAIMVGPGIPEIFEARGKPVLKLESHYPGCARLVPVAFPQGKCPMFGGAFGHTSDSRFSEAIEDLLGHPFYGAVPIHDRCE